MKKNKHYLFLIVLGLIYNLYVIAQPDNRKKYSKKIELDFIEVSVNK